MLKQVSKAYRSLYILVAVAVIALILLLIFSRSTLEDTWQVLINAKLEYVLLLPILQAINYVCIGNYYRTMFANFGLKISPARSWGVVAAMSFVNQILPSGGVSGITYLAYGFRAKLNGGKTTLVQLARYVFSFMGYGVILPFALLLLFFQNDLNQTYSVFEEASSKPHVQIALLLFILIVVFMGYIFLREQKTHMATHRVIRAINAIARIFRKGKNLIKDSAVQKLITEFHKGLKYIQSNKRKMVKPGLSMIASTIMDLSIVYMSLLAVDVHISLGVVFISYIAANIVGVISVIPGDVGVHEATVILVLAAFGVPEAQAISATLLYRVFNKMIFLPIGFYFYTSLLKPATK